MRIVVVSQCAFMFDICCACFLLDFQASQQSYLAVVRVRMIPPLHIFQLRIALPFILTNKGSEAHFVTTWVEIFAGMLITWILNHLISEETSHKLWHNFHLRGFCWLDRFYSSSWQYCFLMQGRTQQTSRCRHGLSSLMTIAPNFEGEESRKVLSNNDSPRTRWTP